MLRPQEVKSMVEQAIAAAGRAYAPYSCFPVGAAVLTEEGQIVAGCNIENASYGLSMCAERNAVFAAIGKGATGIRAVVVYTPTPQPTSPCGACRQVLNEFGPEMDVISVCDGPHGLETTLDKLLPDAFGPHQLT